MARRLFNTKTWNKIGRPDLGSKMFFKDKDGNKIWGKVIAIDYNKKGCVELRIKPF